MLKRWLLCGAVALTLVLLSVSRASAHANLVRANPAPGSMLAQPPTQVQLWFDEAVDVQFSQVQIFDSSHHPVDTGPLQNAAGDPKSLVLAVRGMGTGTFSVVWKALSATDGHITRGVFAFSVGQVTGPVVNSGNTGEGSGVTPLDAIFRWLDLLSLLALVGGLFFRPFLLDRSLEFVGTSTTALAGGRIRQRWEQLSAAALLLALFANAVELLLQANAVTGEISLQSLAAILLDTRYGALWAVRVVLLVAIGALLYAGKRRILRGPGLALGVMALVTHSLESHGAAVQGDFSLAVLSDWMHLFAVSLWVGGLVYFAFLLPIAWRALDSQVRGRWLARLVSRFSLLALIATPVIALTGIYNSALELPTLDALVQTLYGNTLTLKIALFVVMLLFGAVNLLLIRPRLGRSIDAPESSARLFSRFRFTLGAEVLLGLCALFLAGLLTIEPPARSQIPVAGPAGAPNTHVLLEGNAAPDARVQLVIGPNGQAPTQFDARVVDANGQPTANILRVILKFTLLDSDTGTQDLIAQPEADGHYVVTGRPLAIDGMWGITVIVRRKGVEDVSVDFPYYVAPTGHRAHPDDAQARALLNASEQQMNQLFSLRSDQYLNDGANGEVVTHLEYQAPDRMRFTVEGQGTSIAIGPLQYYQEDDKPWTSQTRAVPFVFPQFNLAAQAQWVEMGLTENAADGDPAQIVRFAVANSSGPNGIQYAYWISTRDHRLLQFAMVAEGHYMFQYYTDFDAPDISIQAPSLPAATPTPLPPSNSGTAAP